MKRLLLALALVPACAAPLAAAPTLVQSQCEESATHFSGSSAKTINFDSATTAGNLLIVLLGVRSGRTVSSLNDNNANAFTQLQFDSNSGDASSRAWIYFRENAASATSVTVTLDTTFANQSLICISEWSGMETNADDVTATNEGSTNTADSSNITTTTADAVVVYIVSSSNSAGWTGDADFTDFTLESGGKTNTVSGYKILSSTSTLSATATNATAETWVDLIGAFKGTSGGGGGSTRAKDCTLLGVCE